MYELPNSSSQGFRWGGSWGCPGDCQGNAYVKIPIAPGEHLINWTIQLRFPQKVNQIVTWNAIASMPDPGNQYLWHLTPKEYDTDVIELDLQMQERAQILHKSYTV